MEACSGAHAWARRLRAMGLDARLIAASFVSPYRKEGKSGKNDMTDAAAVCEAASRPTGALGRAAVRAAGGGGAQHGLHGQGPARKGRLACAGMGLPGCVTVPAAGSI